MTLSWINTVDYTTTELVLFGLGCALWVVAYMGVIRGIVKKQFVEIPAVAVMANIAWQVPSTGAGSSMSTSAGSSCSATSSGSSSTSSSTTASGSTATSRCRTRFCAAGSSRCTSWGCSRGRWGWTYFVGEGYDTPTGATSAFLLTVVMGFMYIVLFLQQDPALFSGVVGWTSFLGNALFAGFVLLVLPHKHFLGTMVWVTLLFNLVYVVVFHRRRAAAGTGAVEVTARSKPA